MFGIIAKLAALSGEWQWLGEWQWHGEWQWF